MLAPYLVRAGTMSVKETRLSAASTYIYWSNTSATCSHCEHSKKDFKASTATLKQKNNMFT
jgi:hypothetical protein